MELHLSSHRGEARTPDWSVAAVSGFAAGALLMVLELLLSVATGSNPWFTSHRIAAIAMGPDLLRSADFSIGIVALALVTHYVLGIVFALILCSVIAPFHLDSSLGMALLAGAVFGLLLYLFNFYGMVRYFPWFAEMRGMATLAVHLIFGMSTAAMYWKWERQERH